jgi:hypothetical protein
MKKILELSRARPCGDFGSPNFTQFLKDNQVQI